MPTDRDGYLQNQQGYFILWQWPATRDGGTLTDVVLQNRCFC